MKRLEPITLDLNRCRDELTAFKTLLDRHESETLREKEHVLPFFRKHRNIAALIGFSIQTAFASIGSLLSSTSSAITPPTSLSAMRPGRHMASSNSRMLRPDSVFRKGGKKDTLVWASRFEQGSSQIIDWFWKLDDLARTDTLRHRFEGAKSIRY